MNGLAGVLAVGVFVGLLLAGLYAERHPPAFMRALDQFSLGR